MKINTLYLTRANFKYCVIKNSWPKVPTLNPLHQRREPIFTEDCFKANIILTTILCAGTTCVNPPMPYEGGFVEHICVDFSYNRKPVTGAERGAWVIYKPVTRNFYQLVTVGQPCNGASLFSPN